jgi:parvulin-like peptidyl-prolyl isomerase
MQQSRLNIIFTAFLFSSFVYLIVGFALMKSDWKPAMTSRNLDQILFGVFLLASISLVVVALQIKRTLLQQNADQTVLSKSVLLFALAEVPSILGLVLFLLTAKFSFLVIFCFVSVVAFVLVKPKS